MAGVAVAALVALGCSDSDSDSDQEGERRERTTYEYKDPADAVERYIRRVGANQPGFALAIYEPSVVRDIGLMRLGRSIAFNRGRLGAVGIEVRSVRRLRAARRPAAIVRVEVERPDIRPDRLTFVAVRTGRRWRIAYDRFTRESLELDARVRRESEPRRLGEAFERAGAQAVGVPSGEFGS